MSPLRKRKKKLPRFISLEGNHDYRLTKAIEKNHTLLYDILSTDSFMWEDFNWEYYPYDGGSPAIVHIDGISYTHFICTNATSRAMAGVNLAANIIGVASETIVQGHTHCFDVSRKVTLSGKPIWGVVAGSYLDKTSKAFSYAGTGVKNWWSGIVMLEGVANGSFEDLSILSYETIRSTYEA
jgi:hypothetical protein